MIRRFLNDKRGNYALMTVVAVVPIMGALALGVDYAEMSKQRQETLNALDAAGIATARVIVEGASDDAAKAYAKSFFEINLGSVQPANTTLTVLLPQNNIGGGTLVLTAGLKYKPYFLGTFAKLTGRTPNDVDFSATSEVRLKNTLEVALVLDNSGSMDTIGTGSTKKRIDVLKDASKQLIDIMAKGSEVMKQISKPVQFGLVPFSASVNVGPDKATASWMDGYGISPIHHENFDWSTVTDVNKKMENIGGVWYKKGSGWGTQADQKVTRFTLYDDMQRTIQTGSTTTCTGSGKKKVCTTTPVYGVTSYASWAGCVEARPSPYNINDATPATNAPATLFVPMFAPDEVDSGSAPNNYWADGMTGTTPAAYLARQKNWQKYYTPAPNGTAAATGDDGPNQGCTTTPITPLTDVSPIAGRDAIKASIDAMSPTGNTNVPEGMAWGWRVLSHAEPFTEGRLENDRGNDKVVIVLTDGANTYSTPGGSDYAVNKSTYAAYGYAGHWPAQYTSSRVFQGTTVTATDYSSANYTKAMDAQFAQLCDNAKAANILVITVSLDLKTTVTAEKKAIQALSACASDSRFQKGADGKPKRLYYNATGGTLEATFSDIAAELSNLRIVG
jgi:Flp pilus assembly protein TadG